VVKVERGYKKDCEFNSLTNSWETQGLYEGFEKENERSSEFNSLH